MITRISLIALTAILASGAPCFANFFWNEPNWQVTPSTTINPPNSSASANIGSTSNDLLTLDLHTNAGAPPGPGGGSAFTSVNFSRSFTIVTATTMDLPFRMILSGQVHHAIGGPNPASASFTAQMTLNPVGTNIFLYGAFSSGVTINQNQTNHVVLPSGVYVLNGQMTASASAGSFSLQDAGSDVNATIGLDTTPVPLPGLASPMVFVLGVLSLAIRRVRDQSSKNRLHREVLR